MAVYDMIEKRITGIVEDEQLLKLKRYMQKDHAVLCSLLLHMGKGIWGSAKEYVKEHNLTLPDTTFRTRMREAEEIGLATSKSIGNCERKREWIETDVGYQVNEALLELFGKARVAYKKHSK